MEPHRQQADFGWAILELMGHVRMGGYVTEVEIFGGAMGRIDVYHGDDVTTQYFTGASVYRITPTTESIARAMPPSGEAPVHRWELKGLEPASLPTRRTVCDEATDDSPVGTDDDEPDDLPF